MTAEQQAEPTATPNGTTGTSGSVSPKNRLNDLTAKEWIPETVSVWRQRGLGAGHPDAQIERQHPAPFSFTDVSRLIRFFTKAGQTVLDPFVGVGSTLKAAALEGRRGIGIELNPHFSQLAEERLVAELNGEASLAPNDQRVLTGDARDVLAEIDTDTVDLVVTSPPYWQILQKKDHKVRQERERNGLLTDYGNDPRDLGNIESYAEFLEELTAILCECGRVLRPRQHMCVIVGDFRDGGRYRMFHADLAASLEAQTGFAVKGLTILYQPHKRVYPYGYPSAFVPNLHHQYIIILRNEKA